ncbi:hypothetical protein ACFWGE_32920, partial [Streptomyces bacillaris]|uniref:hypothetical protein n=1 Tax=Streptomyces bacillaris TaxID=68179 RepID=UPI00362725E7
STRKPSGAAKSKPRSPPEPIKIGLYETRGSSTTLRVRTWQKLPGNAEAYQAALQHVAEIIMAAAPEHG